jgi:hypothetical protein
MQFGDFRFPTLGDAVNGVEAAIGNVSKESSKRRREVPSS